MLPQLVWVGLGGAIGASLRFMIAGYIHAHNVTAVPLGTLTVNLAGSLLIGAICGIFSMQAQVPPRMQLFLVTGLLGGFTTFSAFSAENWQLLETGQYRAFMIYVLASNIGGVALAFAGFRFSQLTFNS